MPKHALKDKLLIVLFHPRNTINSDGWSLEVANKKTGPSFKAVFNLELYLQPYAFFPKPEQLTKNPHNTGAGMLWMQKELHTRPELFNILSSC